MSEHVSYEAHAGGNTWVQTGKENYDRLKAEGKIVRELYERPGSGWIKTSERMPDNNQGCLTWNGIHIGKAIFSFVIFQCWQPEKLTNWQPPPAPPQDEP